MEKSVSHLQEIREKSHIREPRQAQQLNSNLSKQKRASVGGGGGRRCPVLSLSRFSYMLEIHIVAWCLHKDMRKRLQILRRHKAIKRSLRQQKIIRKCVL